MPYSVTLLSSLGMLADAWNAVTSATIRNCFEHAFRIPGCSIATSSDCLQTEGDDESQVLSALKAHNIAADLDSYAATDDNLCVCREDTLDDLVAEVLPAQHSSESEEEPEVENVTTAQAFQYIAKLSLLFKCMRCARVTGAPATYVPLRGSQCSASVCEEHEVPESLGSLKGMHSYGGIHTSGKTMCAAQAVCELLRRRSVPPVNPS
ncbi:hypothetical protein HPB51_018840 [Rhipicephalus microplus]|uniref:Uncharacterized protein n=1 Tax=Rhipicephalus microplus TaxID=6941 RepID=A0A9J6DP94_RHIMP|nr:hypothetical protein HPB51_018840 [Rhipicephalus microplus]